MSFPAHAFLLDASTEPSYLEAFSQLHPGALGCVICAPRNQAKTGLALREAGFELKDTLAYVTKNGATHVILAQKPIEKTYAHAALTYSCGALNVNGSRVSSPSGEQASTNGRFPANLILDGSPELLPLFPTTGPSKAASRGVVTRGVYGPDTPPIGPDSVRGHNDSGGSAARFFQACGSQHDLRVYLARLLRCPGDCRALVSGAAEATAAHEAGFAGYYSTPVHAGNLLAA